MNNNNFHESFQQIMKQLHEETGTVGGVVSFFKDDRVFFEDCFGMADVEENRAMTTGCSFDIASCSKAWTVMLLAQAADEGLLDWDAPVQKIIPEFAMKDPYIGSHITVRDLACHRSGLPCHDFMRRRPEISRRYMMEKCKTLDETYGFREKFQYNNHMYIVMGYILERLYGKTWEELCKEKIAKPLGVEDIRFRGIPGNMDNLERALPYNSNGYVSERCAYSDSPVSGPCGGIKLKLSDLRKWVMAMARGGVCESGERLCSEKQYKEIITPLIVCSEPKELGLSGTEYAMAWRVAVYNNKTFVYHSGGLAGFTTQVGFIPGENCGYAMIFNTGSNPASITVRRMAMDVLTTGACSMDNMLLVLKGWEDTREANVAAKNASVGRPLKASERPELAGRYLHPAYEYFDILDKDGMLIFSFGNLEKPLCITEDGRLNVCTSDRDGLARSFVWLQPEEGGMQMKTPDSGLWMKFAKE